MKLTILLLMYLSAVQPKKTRIQQNRNLELLGVKVTCAKNCQPAYTNTMTELRATCKKKTCPSNINFSWSVAPHPSYFDFKEDTIVSENGRELSINSGAFKPGEKISFMALAQGQSASLTLEFEAKDKDYLQITCLENCPPSEPSLDVVFTVECKGCLDVKFDWAIYTTPPNFVFRERTRMSADSRNFTILANSLENRFKGTVVVENWSPGNNRMVATHILKYLHKGPTLEIQCRKNCEVEALASKSRYLQVVCKDQCLKEKYIWTLTPSTSNFEISGSSHQRIKIHAKAYLGGVLVKVAVHLKDYDPIEYSYLTIGDCSINPTKGISGATNFYVNCSYAEDVEVLVYQHIPFSEAYEDGVLLFEGTRHSEVPLLLSEGTPTNITIVIKEIPSHIFKLQVDVEKMPPVMKNESLKMTIKKKILQEDGLTLPALVTAKSFPTAIQMASLLLTSLNELPAGEELFKEHYRRHIMDQIVPVANEMDPEQLVTLLVKVVEGSNIIHDPVIEHLVAEALNIALRRISNGCCYYTNEELKHIGHDALLIIDHLSVKSNKVNDELQAPDSNDLGIDYPVYTDFDPKRAKALYHLQVLTNLNLNSLQTLGSLVDRDKNPMHFQFHNMVSNSQLIRYQPGVIAAPNVTSYLNLSDELASEFYDEDTMVAHLATLNPNTFWWHPIQEEIHSELLMVNFFFKEFKVRSLDNYLDLYIDTYGQDVMPINGTLDDETVVFIYKLDGKAGTKLDVLFHQLDKRYYGLITSTYPPMYEIKEKGFIVRSDRDNHKSYIMEDDIVYIALAKFTGEATKYKMEVKMSNCVSWSDDEKQWTSNHCRLGNYSNSQYTHCQCNHLSAFGVTIIVPPNKIIIFPDMTLKEMIMRSAYVLIFLTCMITLWGIVMIWAHYRDNAMDKAAKEVNVPVDTMPGDEHLYLLSVETGFWFGSGTSARVAVQLIGEKGKSRVHLIHGPGLLQRGNEDWYAIYSPVDLGRVQSIHLFHDCYGSKPHWYCERVTVHHPDSRLKFVFVVQKWFSVIWGDGKVARYIPVSNKEEQLKGKVLFPHHTKRQLKEEHLWLSIFTRPPGCSFTSKERVTVAFTMVLLSMVTSAMFFGLGDPNSLEPHSTVQIAVREIMIIIQSLAITLPAGFLLIIFFKKSRPFALKIRKKNSL